MFAAQERISQIALDKAWHQEANRRAEERKARPESDQEPVQQPTQQSAPPPDPKAEAWAEKNEWFGNDQTMTYAAFGIHKKLIEEEGFDPRTDEYYTELDRRMETEFPHKLGTNGNGSRRPAQNVASVTRTAKGTGRKRRVKLSSSQVAMANKLGVPLEEYAKYVKE